MWDTTYGQKGVSFALLASTYAPHTDDRKYNPDEMTTAGITLKTVMRGAAALLRLTRPRFQAAPFSTIERSAHWVGRFFRQESTFARCPCVNLRPLNIKRSQCQVCSQASNSANVSHWWQNCNSYGPRRARGLRANGVQSDPQF